MSFRVILLLLVVMFLSVYAWRNWFVSLCGAVLLMAVVQHPDFPNSVGGIQGLNPWNLLLFSIVWAWSNRRRAEGLIWDMPRVMSWMWIGYFLVVLCAALRLLADPPIGYTTNDIVSDDIINCFKWVVPAILFYDACRTRQRVTITLCVVLALYLMLAVQVIRWMPLSYAVSGFDLAARASKIVQNEIGYNRVTLSMMLAGGCWAMLSGVVIARTRLHQFAFVGGASLIALGQALTGGRTGYVTWAFVGLILSMIRWRKLLPIIPIVFVAIGIALPGVRDRMLQGFGSSRGSVVVEGSNYELTSGRNLAWPLVVEEIRKAPFIGHGREAMTTTGVKGELWESLGESFPHPHQAYLELLLDNGVVGFLLVIPFYLLVLRFSFRLLLEREDPLVCAVGCAAFSLILALMVGSFGGQTFYPREGAVGMWAAIGIALRVSVQRLRSIETGSTVFEDDEPVSDDSEKFLPCGEESVPA